MGRFLVRLFRLALGLVLFAFGIVFTLKANIGYSPWEILHSGITRQTGVSIGMVSVIVGTLIGIAVWTKGEKFGLGSILNMVVIGILVDLILASDLIPLSHSLGGGALLMLIGLYIIALGSYYYIDAGFGAGPRDGLMLLLTRVTKLPIGLVRGSIEFAAAFLGWLMGGMVGLGTIIAVVGSGFCVQTTFKLLRFNTERVQHETLQETFRHLQALRSK